MLLISNYSFFLSMKVLMHQEQIHQVNNLPDFQTTAAAGWY